MPLSETLRGSLRNLRALCKEPSGYSERLEALWKAAKIAPRETALSTEMLRETTGLLT
jgi:hypothetical protein